MSFSNYSELQTEIANYLHRDDLAAQIPSFITLAEKRLNRSLRLLQQETSAPLTLSSGNNTVALPAGYQGIIDLYFDSDGHQPKVKTLEEINRLRSSTTGRPSFYAITDNIRFETTANQDYALTIDYSKKWDIATDNTNWLLEEAPDAYLYGALIEAKAFVKNKDDLATWSAGLTAAIDDLKKDDRRARKRATMKVDSALAAPARFDIRKG